jgi:hypothetical protein
MKKLFSERHGLTQARVKEELDVTVALALIGLVNAKIDEHWFGLSYPFECQDGRGNAGCNRDRLSTSMAGYNLIWPGDRYGSTAENFPADHQIFDLLEFAYEYVALPNAYDDHSYWGHSHFSYDQEKGREQFAAEVNRIFERNGLAFELTQGEIIRIAPAGLHEALAETIFKTGDPDLDRLLETARTKFLNKSLDVRKEGLEKLWDAWERLKTVEPGKDKKAQTTAILDKAATEPNYRKLLEDEAMLLTGVGNNFMIRHTEMTKTPIVASAHVDYLFHRMFALIRLLLKQSGRGG